MNAFTQNEGRKEQLPVAVKRSLEECATYEDSVNYYKANDEVNRKLTRLRYRKFLNGFLKRKRADSLIQQMSIIDSTFISNSKAP